jgi:hypothetical protein
MIYQRQTNERQLIVVLGDQHQDFFLIKQFSTNEGGHCVLGCFGVNSIASSGW